MWPPFLVPPYLYVNQMKALKGRLGHVSRWATGTILTKYPTSVRFKKYSITLPGTPPDE